MILGTLLIGGGISAAKFVYDLNKATNLDAISQRLTVTSANEIGEAIAKKWELEDNYEKSLKKLVERKKSIVNYIFPRFLDVYSKIMEIDFDFDANSVLKNLDKSVLSDFDANLKAVINFPYHTLTDQQFVSNLIVESIKGWLIGANPLTSMLSGSIKTDSENKLAAAEEYSKVATTYKRTVESSEKAYSALIWQFEILSMQIAKLNGLMLRCARYVDSLIEKNGYKSSNYTEKELEYIMLCINLAALLKECLITPILNSDNELTNAAISLIQTTDTHINAIDGLLSII